MVDGIEIEPIAEGGGIALTIGSECALIAADQVPVLVAAIHRAARARALAVSPANARLGQLVRFPVRNDDDSSA